MFLSKITLTSDARDKRPFWSLIKNCYEVHSLIWDMFSDDPDRTRDFLFRTQYDESLPSFFVVSSRKPENRYDVWNIRCVPYDPVLVKGQQLSFILRANPVRTKTDEHKKKRRHDVVMEAKTRLKQNAVPRESWPSESDIVQKAGFAWLASRAESHGFSIHEGTVRSDGYLMHQVLKPRGKNEIRFSTIEFSGLLTVEDPSRFVEVLSHGIGPAKGFGCGLMLVKPVYQ